MTRRLLIAFVVILALSLASMFLPARELSIESIGWLSFESKVTLSIGSEGAYAAPDIVTRSPSANSGGWANPTNAYADDTNYASIMSGTPSASCTYSGYGFNLTGNTINTVRVRYDAYCAGLAGSQTRYPTGDADVGGTWTLTPAGGSRYEKVDETPANDADYITLTTATGGYSYFSSSSLTVPAGATVNNVTVYYRHRDTATNISYVGSANATGNNPTTGSFSLPGGWAAGDTAIFWWYTYSNTKTFTPPAGVTLKQEASSAGYGHIYIGYRVLQSGDSTFSWTSSSVFGSTTIWGTSVFRGVDTSGDPFEAQSGAPATFTNARDPNPPAVTTVSSNAWVIPIFGKNNDYTSITPPFNYTSAGSNSSAFGNDASAGVAYRQIANPGTENPGTWTLGGGSPNDDGYVWTGALRPVSASSNTSAALKVGGTLYGTTDTGADPTTSWATRSYAFTTNPQTGLAWTVDDVNGTGTNPLQAFGINSTDSNPNISISQCYLVVNYTTTDEQIRVDVSWDGGTSWSTPRQVTNLTGAQATYWYDVTGAPGIPWTPEMLSDANLRVRVDAYTVGAASTVYLDWLPVEVDCTTPTADWLCCYDYRVKLIIDRNDVTEPLTNFPALLYLSTSSGRGPDDVSFIFDELQSDANRFKFTVTTGDGVSECYVEIEKWSQANEQAWLWVRVPYISNTLDTDLYLYFDRDHVDNTAYVGDTNSAAAEQVWDGNFAMVQHLAQNDVVLDSTANNNDETNPPPPPPSGDPDPGYIRAAYTDSGRLDGGYSFSEDATNGTRLQMDHSTSLDITTNLTLETFVYLNNKTEDMKFISKDDPFPGGRGCYCLQQELRGGVYQLELQLDFGAWYRASYATYNAGQWYYLVGTYDGSVMRLYLNGTQVATYNYTGTMTSNPLVALGLGNRAYDTGTSYALEGSLDEVRISNTNRSPAWIFASYESERDNFIDYGAVETYPADIVNTPDSLNFGGVADDSTYWAMGSAPTYPLQDAQCFFTVTNNGDCPIKIQIRATDFTGGVSWTLTSSSPIGMPNQVRMKAGHSGINSEDEMVILTTADQLFVPSLGEALSQGWELKLETGIVSTDEIEKTSTITLTASAA